MKQLIKKHPYASYFTLVFGWTWILIIGLILSGTIKDISKPTPVFIIVGMSCNISPSIIAFIITGVTKGKEGVRALKGRFSIKSPGGLYALALLTVFTVNVLTKFISNYNIREYQFDLNIPLIIMGMVWPFVSGFGEEFGWRGFILPELLRRFKPLTAGIILGIVWEMWHLPMHYMEFKTYGQYMLPAFLVIGFINLTLQSVIMTNIFVRSKGSMRLMVLYHATITGSAIIIDGLVKSVRSPRLIVMESIVSVSVFFVVAVIMYCYKFNKIGSEAAIKG